MHIKVHTYLLIKNYFISLFICYFSMNFLETNDNIICNFNKKKKRKFELNLLMKKSNLCLKYKL